MKGDPQVLRVATSTYEAVVYVENPNATGVIAHAGFTISLYEASSTVPVKVVSDSVYVPKNQDFAIFEGPFDLASSTPARAVLSWDESSLDWVKDESAMPGIVVTQNGISNASSSPRLEASVKNASLAPYGSISLIALIFDDTGTIAAASKTYVDSLAPGESAPATFTWPSGFTFLPASVRIIPTVLPDASYVR
jgi:hypothetical protein